MQYHEAEIFLNIESWEGVEFREGADSFAATTIPLILLQTVPQ